MSHSQSAKGVFSAQKRNIISSEGSQEEEPNIKTPEQAGIKEVKEGSGLQSNSSKPQLVSKKQRLFSAKNR